MSENVNSYGNNVSFGYVPEIFLVAFPLTFWSCRADINLFLCLDWPVVDLSSDDYNYEARLLNAYPGHQQTSDIQVTVKSQGLNSDN